MSKRHDFGRLSRPVKFSVLNSIRLLRCYTIIKRQRLPSSLYSCIQRVTSFVSLNNHLGTLIHAHGCFRFDCPPYHEQSEYLLSIYVIPRLISNGRVATPPNLTCAITQSMEFIVLYLHKSKKNIIVSVILKNVSWNISYLEVRMAFHPFPQLIGEFCNIQPFDPL